MKQEKLSDRVTYFEDALKYIDTVFSRLKKNILETCVERCYKDNRAQVNKSDVINTLHNMGLTKFMDPED